MGDDAKRPRSYRSRVQAKISPYAPADLDDVVAFRGTRFGPDAAITQRDYVRWVYERPLDEGRPSMWIFRTDGAIEGCQGAIRTTLQVDGRELDAMWAAELFLSPAYQLRGVGAVLSEYATEQADVVMAFEVTEAAKRSFLRSGWTDLGDVVLFARPLDVAAFAKARGRALPRPVTGALEVALRGYEGATGLVGRAGRLRLVEIERFDERSDALWAAVAPQYRVIARRDAAMLNWRFAEGPGADTYRCFYYQRGDEVVGHAVFRLGTHGGVAAGWLIDFLCPPRRARALLAEAVRWLRREGAQAVYCIHQPGPLTRAFTLNGFARRSTGWPLMVQTQRIPDEVRTVLADPTNWFITASDSNVDRPREGIVYAN